MVDFFSLAPLASLAPLGLFLVLGLVVGFPLMSTSFTALKRIQEGNVVALNALCPSCGSDVYCFVQADSVGEERKFVRESSECHVCQTKLDFRAFIDNREPYEGPDSDDVLPPWSPLRGKLKRWAYGRVYGMPSKEDLRPPI